MSERLLRLAQRIRDECCELALNCWPLPAFWSSKRHLIEVPLDIQRNKAFWWLLEGFNKRFYCHLGLFQDTSQCTDGQFAVQGHDASHCTFWGLLLEYHVATSLPHLLKAQPFQRTNSLPP